MKSEEQQPSTANSSTGGSTGSSSTGGSGSGAATGTRPPTNADKTRHEQVIQYLVDVGVATRATLESNPNSPQYKAANWIANVDEYQIPLPSGVGVDAADELPVHTRFTERYALAVLYYATGGDSSWKYSMRFMEPSDHCEWYQDFITTSGSILRLGVSECKTLGTGFEDELVHGLELRT